METLVSVELCNDGSAKVMSTRRTVVIQKQTVELLTGYSFLGWKIHEHGYLCHHFTPLHRVVGDAVMTDEAARKSWGMHFSEHPDDRIVVAHLDNNRLNCNAENLQKIPAQLNNYQKLRQPRVYSSREGKGDKFRGLVSLHKRTVSTKQLHTSDEAKHAMDILKLSFSPAYFRDYIFKHGLHKPAGYMEHYCDVETLLARAFVYTKAPRKKPDARQSKNKFVAYRSLEAAREAVVPELFTTIEALLATPGIAPFDPEIHAVMFYTGGLGKQLVCLLDYAFFEMHLEATAPSLTMNNGYLKVLLSDGPNFLHNVVLGRRLGQRNKDGLCGGHGIGKTLDNRLCSLKTQTNSQNNSERGNFLKHTAPGVTGVYLVGKKYISRIALCRGCVVHLGCFETAELASAVYEFASANKHRIVKACTDKSNRMRGSYARSCCKERRIL